MTEPSEHTSDNIVLIFGITGIVILEALAMYLGMDGQLLSAAIGAIATIVGYTFGRATK